MEVLLDREGLLVGVHAGPRYLAGEFLDPRVGTGRQLCVDLYIGWEGPRGGRELAWERIGSGGFHLVVRTGGSGPGAEDRAGVGGQPPVTARSKAFDPARGARKGKVAFRQDRRHVNCR